MKVICFGIVPTTNGCGYPPFEFFTWFWVDSFEDSVDYASSGHILGTSSSTTSAHFMGFFHLSSEKPSESP